MPVTRYVNAVEVVHRPVPDGVELPPLPTQADRWVGHYQRVLLNVRTGELSFFCADWRVHAPIRDKGGDRAVWTSQYPGGGSDSSVHSATEPIPELLMFFIDTWTRADVPATARPATPVWTFMTREQGDAFVAALVPLAQQLVDNCSECPEPTISNGPRSPWPPCGRSMPRAAVTTRVRRASRCHGRAWSISPKSSRRHRDWSVLSGPRWQTPTSTTWPTA